MTQKEYREYLNVNRISDGLLRENVLSGNYAEACKDCDVAIQRRHDEINALTVLKAAMENEKEQS